MYQSERTVLIKTLDRTNLGAFHNNEQTSNMTGARRRMVMVQDKTGGGQQSRPH